VAAPTLPRAGWTVTTDSQGPAPYGASSAIDGNPATFWHTRWLPKADPLLHSLTIDMHATNLVTGLVYLPRQTPARNGNVGRYQISVSADGARCVSVSKIFCPFFMLVVSPI